MPKIVAIQMCSTAEVDENLAMAARLIQQAAEQGAHLIVLPEMFSIMGKTSFDKRLVPLAFSQFDLNIPICSHMFNIQRFARAYRRNINYC